MGSGQSARKLTISNKDEDGVIRISDELIERIIQPQRTHELPNAKPTAPVQQPPPPNTSVTPPASDNSTPAQPLYYYPDLTISALQMQQQMENQLKQQDQYWQRRLKNLENGYQQINGILEEEYKKATSETSAKPGQKIDIQNTVQPCFENSNKVLKCFQDYPKESLRCSNLVEEFSNCVWNVHARMVETRA
ncbi:hypothetical protein PUN28_008045 [Cardiocondyla obscurior]|uniref:Uncharacterized protein n=1 Tax=Cardiocondyla obscurior TaxID=286306 RepID=A0AAW2FXD9_9HYME